jgi:replicative DNA helicase
VPKLRTAFQETFDKVVRWKTNPKRVWGLSTGLKALDHLTGGLHDEEFTILAARPSKGKTALAAQIAYQVAETFSALDEPRQVVYFSTEMAGWQLNVREIARRLRIPVKAIKTGEITDDQLDQIKLMLEVLSALPITIDDTSAISVDLAGKRLEEHLDSGKKPGLVILDHFHNISGDPAPYIRISNASHVLKDWARIYHCPVLGLSQMSRKLEDREDPTPQLSDLRESGNLEQDAANVWFIENDRSSLPHEARIVVAKTRDGEVGTVPITFNPPIVAFEDGDNLPF